MKTPPTYEILLENLATLGYPPENKPLKVLSVIPDTRNGGTKHAYCALSNNLYLFAFDAFRNSSYPASTFTGIYTDVDLPPEAEYRVMKRDWTHFIFKNRRHLGNHEMNRLLTIISPHWVPGRELSKHNVDLFISLHNTGSLYTLLVKDNYLPQIEELKGKKILGIETRSWLYKKEELARFIDQGQQLILDLKRNCR